MADATYVYVSQHGSEQISVLRMNADGHLTPIQNLFVGGKVMPMAISPDRRFLHAALRNEPWSIASFAIDPATGELTALGTAPAVGNCVYVASDRTGRFLFGVSNPQRKDAAGSLFVSAIGENGCARPPHLSFDTPPKPHAIIVDPTNRFLLAPCCDGDAILRYAFDAATGRAEPLPPAPVDAGRGPRHLVFHPNERFLYVVNEYDGSVSAFGFAAETGTLTPIHTLGAVPADYVPGMRRGGYASAGGADIHVTPDGRWLFASIRGPLTMVRFAIDPDSGALTRGPDFPMPREPRGFAVDPTGRFLFVAGDDVARLAAFAIDADSGELTPIADYAMGEGPNWVECITLG